MNTNFANFEVLAPITLISLVSFRISDRMYPRNVKMIEVR